MQGSDQSVAFDYQLPAAPLLAPWHEHHIRRSDLHRNVSVSIVVSKFTIYRHSRRSLLRKHCSAGLPVEAHSFLGLCFLHILLVGVFSFYPCSGPAGEVKLHIHSGGVVFCGSRWALFMIIDRESRSSVFPPLQPRRRRKEQWKKKKGINFTPHFGSRLRPRAFIFISLTLWRFPAFLKAICQRTDFTASGSLYFYKIGFPNGWLQFTLELASRHLHILIGRLSIASCFWIYWSLAASTFLSEIGCSELTLHCRAFTPFRLPAPTSERPVRLKALFGPEIWQW